ncbi:MAG: hypothetical protein ACI9TY_000377 [Alphaproteobacteria bacterium]
MGFFLYKDLYLWPLSTIFNSILLKHFIFFYKGCSAFKRGLMSNFTNIPLSSGDRKHGAWTFFCIAIIWVCYRFITYFDNETAMMGGNNFYTDFSIWSSLWLMFVFVFPVTALVALVKDIGNIKMRKILYFVVVLLIAAVFVYFAPSMPTGLLNSVSISMPNAANTASHTSPVFWGAPITIIWMTFVLKAVFHGSDFVNECHKKGFSLMWAVAAIELAIFIVDLSTGMLAADFFSFVWVVWSVSVGVYFLNIGYKVLNLQTQDALDLVENQTLWDKVYARNLADYDEAKTMNLTVIECGPRPTEVKTSTTELKPKYKLEVPAQKPPVTK